MARQSNSNVRMVKETLANQPTGNVYAVKKATANHSSPASYTQLLSLNGSFDASDYAIMSPDITPAGLMEVTAYFGSDSSKSDKPMFHMDTAYYLKDAANYQQWGRGDQDLCAIGSWIETGQKFTASRKA